MSITLRNIIMAEEKDELNLLYLKSKKERLCEKEQK